MHFNKDRQWEVFRQILFVEHPSVTSDRLHQIHRAFVADQQRMIFVNAGPSGPSEFILLERLIEFGFVQQFVGFHHEASSVDSTIVLFGDAASFPVGIVGLSAIGFDLLGVTVGGCIFLRQTQSGQLLALLQFQRNFFHRRRKFALVVENHAVLFRGLFGIGRIKGVLNLLAQLAEALLTNLFASVACQFVELTLDIRDTQARSLHRTELDRKAFGRFDIALTKRIPVLFGGLPSELGRFIQGPFVFDRVGETDPPFRADVVEGQWTLVDQRHAAVDEIVTAIQPQTADQPVVRFAIGTAGIGTVDPDPIVEDLFVESFVVTEQFAELSLLIGHADLLAKEPSGEPDQSRFAAIQLDTTRQEIGSLFDPLVTLTVVVEFDRNVIRKVMCLVLPHFFKVRLQQSDLVQRSAQPIPFLVALVIVRLLPQHGCRNSTHSEGCEFHRFTGRIDLSQVGN